ncbi:MAG TPA: hypothetical protein VKL21_11030 [Candidatus Methanoperedens sp.]|nr:hypothetical protein [Candidatus Methanoperedens sp.]
MKKIIREETIEESFEHGNGTATVTKKKIKAIQEGEKIIVVIEEDGNESVFCNYLKDEYEVMVFFNSIRLDEDIMKNEDFGTNYRYGENPKSTTMCVYFTLPYGEIFSDGLWLNEERDELYKNRDDAK